MQLRQQALTAGLITGVCLLSSGRVISQDAAKQVLELRLARPGELIAGIPQEEALQIYHRHVKELQSLPGVASVSFTANGLVVEVRDPSVLPAAVEGLPVIPVAPVDPWAVRAIDGSTPVPPRPVVEPPPSSPSDLPPVEPKPMPTLNCGTDAHWDKIIGRCRRNVPITVPQPKFLPPPAGVIVLKPNGVREPADRCPQSFKEIQEQEWRFCVEPTHPEPIPPLWMPPVAGIPYEKALKIFERHQEELMKLPGVGAVGMGLDGIRVETNDPVVVPPYVEGLPIKVFPFKPAEMLSQTLTQAVRPLHGAVAIRDSFFPTNIGNLTGAVLSQGKPWLVFPAHLLLLCDDSSPCPPPQGTPPLLGASILNQCLHYGNPSSATKILQPSQGNTQTVGFVQRWDPAATGLPRTSDVAAAFMDNNTSDGDGSLSADRRLEEYGFFNGEGLPSAGTQVTVVTADPAGSGFHMLPALIIAINQIMSVNNSCVPGTSKELYGQTILQAVDFCFFPGDSGSPVVDGQGRIVGMFNWAVTPAYCDGGGTNAATIKAVLGFDSWYATNIKDQTIGVFRPGTHQWFLDNGSARMDACGADQRYNDTCLGTFGSTGERPVVGNWTGRGVYQQGQYRIGIFSPAINAWILDSTGNGTYDDCNLPTGDWCPQLNIPSQPTDLPVVGDWNGDGRIKIGQFRPSTAQWFLDWNGNGVWNGCSTDRCYTFGLANDKPVVGDWSGNGRTKLGVFRNGTWFLDASGNGAYGTGDRSFVFGITGDTPVAGNWSGTPKSKIGVFRYELGQGTWFLDGDGSETFSGCAIDGCYVYGSQASGDLPAIWKPSTVKAN